MDRLFLYLGICIWIWAGKHNATWHVSGYTPMRCVSRHEAGNIMNHDGTCDKCGLQAIQDKKHALCLCPRSPCMQMCSLRLQFADLFHDLPLAHKITVNQTGVFFYFSLVLGMSSIFSRNKRMIPIISSQSSALLSIRLMP